LAEQVARGFIDAQRAGRIDLLEQTKLRRTAPTIAEVINEYHEKATVRKSTQRQNLVNLRAILRVLSIQETASVLVLDKQVVPRVVEAGHSLGWADTYTHAVLRTARSVWAKSLAGRCAYMDCLPEFATAKLPPMPRPGGFRRFPASVYRAICRDVLSLRDPALTRAFILISRCGLANREIYHATGLWLDPVSYSIRVPSQDGSFRPKSQNRVRTIAMKSARFCKHFAMFANKAERIVPNAGIRVNRTLSKIVRARLPGRTKSTYELRKYAGSLIASHMGMLPAARLLGDRVSTAEAYYVDFLGDLPRV
jgi:hypothetical protein